MKAENLEFMGVPIIADESVEKNTMVIIPSGVKFFYDLHPTKDGTPDMRYKQNKLLEMFNRLDRNKVQSVYYLSQPTSHTGGKE